jgi:prevent-host-death family protein
MTAQVGIKELRDGLSRYVGDVHETGRALIITDRGKPVAKIVSLEPWDERYARLVAEGAITPPSRPRGKIPRPATVLTPGPTMADIVIEQRG